MTLRLPGFFLLFILMCCLCGCANIVAPQGGPKDITPPRLLSVTPQDSLLNTRVTRIELRFDEYIALNSPATEITVSPILPFPLVVEGRNRSVVIQIPDSLLQPNTTYRISFGNAIRDLNESNPFAGYSYTFSTGSYFDTLGLGGYVIDAATGLRDSGALVVLYHAQRSDSSIVREKPLYAVKTDLTGSFRFAGLPARSFKIYALKDANNNMVYDGAGEMVAFYDQLVFPVDTLQADIVLRLFAAVDTTRDTSATAAFAGRAGVSGKPRVGARETTSQAAQAFSYSVKVDTTDARKRTKDITQPLEIVFTLPVDSVNMDRIHLAYDSAEIAVEVPVWQVEDTVSDNTILLGSDWKEDAMYTLRLLKGFAKDSAGADVMPGRYTFRTKRDDDYGKLQVHLPSRYLGDEHLFVLLKDKDTIYHKPVTDTIIRFTRLQPGAYTMRVAIDRNRNGKWDPGDLFGRVQPEEVVPFLEPINLRAGWENMIDFERPVRTGTNTGASPARRGTPR